MSQVSARIVCAMRDFATRRIGREIADEVFETACNSRDVAVEDASDPRGWVSLEAFHAIADGYGPLIGEDFIADAVTWIVPERRQLSSMSLSSIASPAFFYRNLDRARSFYAKHVRFEVAVERSGAARVQLHYDDGLDRRPESCAVARGVLAAIPLLFDMPAAAVVETQCYASGGDTCSYQVTWRERPGYRLWGFAGGAVIATPMLLLGINPVVLILPIVGLVLGSLAGGVVHRRYLSKVVEEQRQSLGEAERDFQRRFGEIIDLRNKLTELGQLQASVVNIGLEAILGELVGELAHEMRNPMSYVLNNLSVLELAADKPDEYLAELHDVVADIRHGVEEMRGVLGWFTDGFNATTTERRELDLNVEIREAAKLLRRDWGSRIQLHLELSDELPEVRSFGRELVQVLVNLLINASHALDEGNIWVSTERDDRHVVLAIRDDGVGMSSETLARVFDRGFTTKSQGSGLGLYISRRIIERNDGTIELDSEPGRGTTATVRVPAVVA